MLEVDGDEAPGLVLGFPNVYSFPFVPYDRLTCLSDYLLLLWSVLEGSGER